MLSIELKKRKTSYDLKIRSLAQQIANIWDDLDDFERVFNARIQKVVRHNTVIASTVYRLVRKNDNTVEIWHVNIDYNPDRLIAIVTN